MKIKARKNHIIVEKPEEEEQVRNGIIIPTAQTPLMKAKVVSVGKGMYDEKGKWISSTITEGQTILFSKGTGQSTALDGKEYIFFKPEDILAVVKDNG